MWSSLPKIDEVGDPSVSYRNNTNDPDRMVCDEDPVRVLLMGNDVHHPMNDVPMCEPAQKGSKESAVIQPITAVLQPAPVVMVPAQSFSGSILTPEEDEVDAYEHLTASTVLSLAQTQEVSAPGIPVNSCSAHQLSYPAEMELDNPDDVSEPTSETHGMAPINPPAMTSEAVYSPTLTMTDAPAARNPCLRPRRRVNGRVRLAQAKPQPRVGRVCAQGRLRVDQPPRNVAEGQKRILAPKAPRVAKRPLRIVHKWLRYRLELWYLSEINRESFESMTGIVMTGPGRAACRPETNREQQVAGRKRVWEEEEDAEETEEDGYMAASGPASDASSDELWEWICLTSAAGETRNAPSSLPSITSEELEWLGGDADPGPRAASEAAWPPVNPGPVAQILLERERESSSSRVRRDTINDSRSCSCSCSAQHLVNPRKGRQEEELRGRRLSASTVLYF